MDMMEWIAKKILQLLEHIFSYETIPAQAMYNANLTTDNSFGHIYGHLLLVQLWNIETFFRKRVEN